VGVAAGRLPVTRACIYADNRACVLNCKFPVSLNAIPASKLLEPQCTLLHVVTLQKLSRTPYSTSAATAGLRFVELEMPRKLAKAKDPWTCLPNQHEEREHGVCACMPSHALLLAPTRVRPPFSLQSVNVCSPASPPPTKRIFETKAMRTLYILGLLVPLICYLLDSSLPKFYIFDPVKLQELSKASIEAGAGNTTVVMQHLVAALQEEYGSQHVNGIEKEKWFFK
jgi:hypothetical protein